MSTVDPIATEGRHQCDNCEWEGQAEALRPIRSLESRLDPGGIVPSGECPYCGALAYPVKRTRWLFVFHGGIDPGEALGPVRDDDHQDELILAAMRDPDNSLALEGDDTIHWIEVAGTAKPELGSFSGHYVNGLRERVEQEER